MGENSIPETPWARLRQLVNKALAPVPIGGKVRQNSIFFRLFLSAPPSWLDEVWLEGTVLIKVEPVPEGLKQWGVNSATVMAGGLGLGAIRQWLEERKTVESTPPADLPTKAHVARFKAELQTRRVARVLNSTIRGGLWCGACGGLYYAVQGLSLYSRQIDDAYNTVFGAWAAGSLMGFTCKMNWMCALSYKESSEWMHLN